MAYDFILPAGIMMHMQRTIASDAEMTRYYLSGVHVEPIPGGGAFLVATDGHAMLIHRASKALAVRAATIKLVEPKLPHEIDEWGEPVVMDWSRVHVRISTLTETPFAAQLVHQGREDPHMHIIAEEIRGPFPNWRKPLDSDFSASRQALKPGPRIDHVDARRLARICALWSAVRITQLRQDHPHLITMEDDPDTPGVLAPRAVRAPDTPPLTDMLTAIGRQDILQAGGGTDG